MIENKLHKNYKHKKKWAQKSMIEAYRLYDKDIPEYPYIIDIYLDFIVIYEKGTTSVESTKRIAHQHEIKAALIKIFNTTDNKIILKERTRLKDKFQYSKNSNLNKYIQIRENEALFKINLFDYLDTGIFLDHRPIREKIKNICKSQSANNTPFQFLNLFSYTGTASVMAALGGAKTTSVDMNTSYQNWAQENFKLNNIDLKNHIFINQNVLEFLETHEKSKIKYDLIFLDPPTFSNSKKMNNFFEVEKDQIFLIEQCMKLLTNSGTLYFSTNKRSFKLAPEIRNKFDIKDISHTTIPSDFKDKNIHYCFEIIKL